MGTVRTKATCEDCDATLVASTRRQRTELEKRATEGRTRFGAPAVCRLCRHRRDTEIFNEPPDEAYDRDPEAWEEDCSLPPAGARLSLVDWTSFEMMRDEHLTDAFAFDRHFAEQGFVLRPAS